MHKSRLSAALKLDRHGLRPRGDGFLSSRAQRGDPPYADCLEQLAYSILDPHALRARGDEETRTTNLSANSPLHTDRNDQRPQTQSLHEHRWSKTPLSSGRVRQCGPLSCGMKDTQHSHQIVPPRASRIARSFGRGFKPPPRCRALGRKLDLDFGRWNQVPGVG